jgi:hypothetical protein
MQPEDIDPSQIVRNARYAPDEIRVQAYMRDIRAGKPMKRLVVLPTENGYALLGDESCARFEAYRRCGVMKLGVYVVDVDKDTPPEAVERLRQALNEAEMSQN